jgi:hypothetical protein
VDSLRFEYLGTFEHKTAPEKGKLMSSLAAPQVLGIGAIAYPRYIENIHATYAKK